MPLGTIDLGSFEVLSVLGDEEDDEPANETTEMMPPLPLGLWFKRTDTFCEKFRKPCNEDHQDEEQSDALQQMDPWARNTPKSEPDVEGLPLDELPCVFSVPEAGSVPTSAEPSTTV